MMEHDYLTITDSNHQCLLQDVGKKGQKQTVCVPVSHLLFNVAKGEDVDLSQITKRGSESIFSTQMFLPKNTTSSESAIEHPDFFKSSVHYSFKQELEQAWCSCCRVSCQA